MQWDYAECAKMYDTVLNVEKSQSRPCVRYALAINAGYIVVSIRRCSNHPDNLLLRNRAQTLTEENMLST